MKLKGRGRRPDMPNFEGKASNKLLLQVYWIKSHSGASWDHVENWMLSMFPEYPKSRSRYLIEKCVQGVEKLCMEEDRIQYYQLMTDLNRIGK